MSNRKILFFDIDGTLISESSGEIPESTKTALKRAQENGHITIINTGRTRALIEPRLQDMGFDGYICEEQQTIKKDSVQGYSLH